MERFIFLATAVFLLLAGCSKEPLNQNREGVLQSVTFTATMSDAFATKAAVDGNASHVNRCIMEVYYDNTLFKRLYAKVSDKSASFTTEIISNRAYAVVFWADCVADNSTEGDDAPIKQDLYYTTDAEGGLQSIALKGTYAGNDDRRDAFFYSSDNVSVAQGGCNYDVQLKRPFAQINVITTDWDTVMPNEAIKPTTVNVTVKSPFTKFNAVTGEAYEVASSLQYSTNVYTSPGSGTDATLSMDYLFAAESVSYVEISWQACNTATLKSHSFVNIPYQRNYRSNIKGDLLTE